MTKTGTVPCGDSPCFSVVSFLIILALCCPVFAAQPEGEFYPAQVKDISDRAYETAVIQLLDNAKESIVMSMYMIKPVGTGPVYLRKGITRGRGEIYVFPQRKPIVKKIRHKPILCPQRAKGNGGEKVTRVGIKI